MINCSNKISKIIFSVIAIISILSCFVSLTVPTQSNAAELVIVLDPGHGGTDPGACNTVDGVDYQEKSLNLKIALSTKRYLSQFSGVRVEMTRTDDTALTLAQRVSKANKLGAHSLISIHNNSSSSPDPSGTLVLVANSTYRTEVTKASQAIGTSVLKHMTALGLRDRGTVAMLATSGDYVVYYPDGSPQDYYGIIQRSMRAGFPGIIVESAFISSPDDVRNYLSSDQKLETLGIAIGKGIAEFYGLSTEKTYDTTARTPIDAQKLTFNTEVYSQLIYPLGETKRVQGDGAAVLSSSNSAPTAFIDYMGMSLNAEDNLCAVITAKASYNNAKLTVFCGSDEIVVANEDYCLSGTMTTDYIHYVLDFTKLPGWAMGVNFLQLSINGAESISLKDIEFFTNTSSVPYSDTVTLSLGQNFSVTPTEHPTAVPTIAPTKAPTQAPTATPTATPTAEPTPIPTAAPTAVVTAAPTAAPMSETTNVTTPLQTEKPIENSTQSTQDNSFAPENSGKSKKTVMIILSVVLLVVIVVFLVYTAMLNLKNKK